MANKLKALFQAANAPNKARFMQLLESFQEWHNSAQEQFDLESPGVGPLYRVLMGADLTAAEKTELNQQLHTLRQYLPIPPCSEL
jgi:hypothetical protein